MDFIEGLPKSKGKTFIWVVVDVLSKYAHFIGLFHTYSAGNITKLFIEHIHKLHGMLEDLVSDRDLIFTSKVWQELFAIMRVTLNILSPSNWWPNRGGEHIKKLYLAAAEWKYSTTFYYSIQTTPFEALYGQPPSLHLPYVAGDSGVEEVDKYILKMVGHNFSKLLASYYRPY